MRPSFLPLTGTALVICCRLWVTVKELSWLEAYAMIMSSVVFAYKKRKKFLPFLRNLWSSLGDLNSAVDVSPSMKVETKGKKKLPQDTPKETRKMTPSYDANSSLKKRPWAKNMKNSAQTASSEANTSTNYKDNRSRITSTLHIDKSLKPLQTSCTMCKKYISINNPSDMPAMPGCYHKYCVPCFEAYFSDIIDQMEVSMWLCPECGDSSIADYLTYFQEFADIINRFMRKDLAESACEKLDKWFYSQESMNTRIHQSEGFCKCDMCLKTVRESEVIRMPSCEHSFCETCTKNYFNIEIDEHELAECYCPFCEKISKENLSGYFTNLGEIIRPLLHPAVLRKFEKKLKELSYTDMCIKCYSPVTAPPKYDKVIKCQYCSTQACRECRLLWDASHYSKNCKEYKLWIQDLPCHAYQMSRQPIDCISCGERFLDVRDGTLLFSCPKCQAQMCRSCRSPFYLGIACPVGEEKCSLFFFHAHHPENCLFYLQNKEVDVLFKLLKNKKLNPKQTSKDSYSCEVEVKKIVRNQTIYVKCDQILYNNYLGLCKNHAVDFLSTIAFKNSVDTLELFNKSDLATFKKRSFQEVDKQQIDCGTQANEQNVSQILVPHASWQHTVTNSSTKSSNSDESQFQVTHSSCKQKETEEVTTAGSSRIEPNESALPDKKPEGVATTCNLKKEDADAPVCSCCLDNSQNQKENIFGCIHNFCNNCIQFNFRKFVYWENHTYLSCPKCQRPNIFEDNKVGQAYLKALSIALQKFLNENLYEQFKEKLEKYITSLNHSDQGRGGEGPTWTVEPTDDDDDLSRGSGLPSTMVSDTRYANLENGETNSGVSSDVFSQAGTDADEMIVDG